MASKPKKKIDVGAGLGVVRSREDLRLHAFNVVGADASNAKRQGTVVLLLAASSAEDARHWREAISRQAAPTPSSTTSSINPYLPRAASEPSLSSAGTGRSQSSPTTKIQKEELHPLPHQKPQKSNSKVSSVASLPHPQAHSAAVSPSRNTPPTAPSSQLHITSQSVSQLQQQSSLYPNIQTQFYSQQPSPQYNHYGSTVPSSSSSSPLGHPHHHHQLFQQVPINSQQPAPFVTLLPPSSLPHQHQIASIQQHQHTQPAPPPQYAPAYPQQTLHLQSHLYDQRQAQPSFQQQQQTVLSMPHQHQQLHYWQQ